MGEGKQSEGANQFLEEKNILNFPTFKLNHPVQLVNIGHIEIGSRVLFYLRA